MKTLSTQSRMPFVGGNAYHLFWISPFDIRPFKFIESAVQPDFC